MIDFDRLVLAPAMASFARPIVILPAEGTPYLGRGDFRSPTTDVQLDDGSLTTAAPTLGLRRSEFPSMPVQDDQLYVDILLDATVPHGFVVTERTRRFAIVDVRPDGEGDVKLVLAEVSSP